MDLKDFVGTNRAVIVYIANQGYAICEPWFLSTGRGRYTGDHPISGNAALPILNVVGHKIYPDNEEGLREAEEQALFLNDRKQFDAAPKAKATA